MKKLTVRVDDEAAEAFAHFCGVNGVSMQSTLQAALDSVVRYHNEHGNIPVEQWPSDSYNGFRRMVLLARELDSVKRRRGRPAP